MICIFRPNALVDDPDLGRGRNWITDFLDAVVAATKRALFVLFVLLLLPPFSVQGNIYYVSTNGLNNAPYTNWTDASTSLQSAIDQAQNGDTVFVSNGQYNVTSQVVVSRGVQVIGVGGSTSAVINAQGMGRCFYLTHSNALIQGFQITGGLDANGGGVYCVQGTVKQCLVFNNEAYTNGGGIWTAGQVLSCNVESNRAATGGGIYTSTGSVSGCSVWGNTCSVRGAGIESIASTVANCNIYENQGGSGVWLSNTSELRECIIHDGPNGGVVITSSSRMKNCLVYRNTGSFGAGVYISGGSDIIIDHCTITGNTGGTGAGIRSYTGGDVRNSIIISNNGPNISIGYSPYPVFSLTCVTPWQAGQGNITNPPGFVSLSTADYHLSSNSPCIDQASDSSSLTNDLNMIPRPLDGNHDGIARSDIGCHEFVDAISDSDNDLMPDGWELINGLSPIKATGNDGATADLDSDGVSNLGEYLADTNPTNAQSLLRISELSFESGGIKIDWSGGVQAMQFLEFKTTLLSTSETWAVIYTNQAPTSTTNTYLFSDTTNGNHFYRIRARR